MTATITQAHIHTVADAIRQYDLDGLDVHDLAASIDLDEPEYVGAGSEVWKVVADLADQLAVSATFLLDEACIALGWDVRP